MVRQMSRAIKNIRKNMMEYLKCEQGCITCVIKMKRESFTVPATDYYILSAYHIKVDWETHQLQMKCRDKLSRPMAGPIFRGGFMPRQDYKGRRALKSCHPEFHRIL